MVLKDHEFESEVNNLIEWCEDLDYEKYIGNWHQLATSAYSGAAQEKYNLTGLNSNANLQMMMKNGAGESDGFAQMEQDQPPQYPSGNVDGYEARLKDQMYNQYGGQGGADMSQAHPSSMQAKMMDLE